MAAISSLGVGSGLDLGSLVSGLLEAERAPTANRLAVKEQNFSTELSAFGLLRSSLSQFQGSLSGLQSATAFDAKKVSLSDSSIFSATAENSADPGSYSIEVTALAKAQSLATSAATAFDSVDDTIDSGTLTVQFGTTTTGPYAFTADPTSSPQTIVVSATNNNTTLAGLRDYINDDANGYGMQASIVNDGNGYRLLLTSENSGAANSMEITSSGDGDGNDNDNAGLSQLAFNASAQSSMTQTVGAQDAALSINGLGISSETNTINNAITGLSIDLLKADVGNLISVNVQENRDEVTASVKNFVKAYNELRQNIDALTSYDPETGTGSALSGDFTVRSISSQIRNVIFGSLSSVNSNIRSLVDVGITTNSSGILELDSGKLADALLDYPDEVEALFSLTGSSSDPGIGYVSASAETQPGDYSVNVTSLLTQGVLTGSGPVTDLRVQSNSDNMTLIVDGFSTGSITLTNTTYLNEAALASEIQTQINAASTLVANGVSVTVSYDVASDRFVITSDSSGSASTVEITAIDPQAESRYGLAVDSGIDGTDLVGSIDGVNATIDGQMLTSPTGNSQGLSIEILSGSTGNRGTVSLTRGLADRLDSLLSNFLDSDGFIASREESINGGLDDIVDERIKLDDRISSLEARLIRQFSALDILVAQFNQTSIFLTQQLANLPKPNSINSRN
jgi:flagellar hook-associated protein 2